MSPDLELLRGAAEEAGRLALSRRTSGLTIERKPDGSPVTNADLEVDALLTRTLRAVRPDYGWLSEETADAKDRLRKARVFMVDPIDGTRAYMRGKPWWVVSVAVVEAGRATCGALYAPELDEMYLAERGGGATLNGAPIRASAATALNGCRMLGDAAGFRDPRWAPPWPEMQVAARNAVAYRMAAVAAGAFDACVALSSKHDWDLAAGQVIAEEAGAAVLDHRGEALAFNTPEGKSPSLVCCAPGLAGLILARTRPIDLAA